MKLFKLLVITFICSLTLISSKLMAKQPQPTGFILTEAGNAFPQTELSSWVEPGTAYRLKLFGGAKVKLGPVGAVGLGWDLTYSQHDIKESENGFYRRFTWDYIFLSNKVRLVSNYARTILGYN